jgi:hydrogenase maturation factor HypF (carbamoyltransferase family)
MALSGPRRLPVSRFCCTKVPANDGGLALGQAAIAAAHAIKDGKD